jgi:hypothetical protein
VGKFVPEVIMVERGDNAGAFCFLRVGALQSIPLYSNVHLFGESDS